MKQNVCIASMCFPNRTAAGWHIFISVSAFILAIGFSPPVWSGVIRTTISSHCTITASGDLELRMDIRNKGNVKAHKMAATLTIFDVIRRYPDLGENPDGGKMTLEDRIDRPGWNPGVYAGIITVSFEEQNGKTHFADHFFTVQYRTKSSDLRAVPLELRANSLVFNPSAFWIKEEPLRVTLENREDTAITPDLHLYLPEGFNSPDAAGTHPLPPKSERVVTLSVLRDANAESNKAFHLIATYDLNGLHYTSLLKKVIRMEKKPVLFKVYVMGSGAMILLVWGFLMVVGRKVKSEE